MNALVKGGLVTVVSVVIAMVIYHKLVEPAMKPKTDTKKTNTDPSK